MVTIYSDYDSIIKIICPDYKFFLSTIADNLSSKTKVIINLGTGSGNLEKEIFILRPEVKIYGLDLDSNLLDLAKTKLRGYNFFPIRGNIFDLRWPECDAIISSITIHHFDDAQKKELFKRIYSHLPINGLFINYDYLLKSKKEKERSFALTKQKMLQHGFKEDYIDKLTEEAYKNDKPMSLENQKVLLKNLGFNFKLLHKKSCFAAYKCIKPNQKTVIFL